MNFDRRYSESWDKEHLFLYHTATHGLCCWCLRRESQEVHHARYKDSRGAIAGRERVGVDVFPVCKTCHTLIHTSAYWIRDRLNPVLGNHNTTQAYTRLKFGYSVLSGAAQ